MKRLFYVHKKWRQYDKVKLLSLLSAFFLWFYVVTDNYFDHTLKVPIRLVNRPRGWILTQPIPSKAEVTFRGSGKTLLSLRYRDKYIELDLDQTERTAKLPLTVEMIKGIPTGMAVTPIRVEGPDSVTVELDRFARREVPVQPQITMIPMDGYTQVGELVIEPDSVTLSGPESLVRSVSDIPTEQKQYRNVIKKIQGKVSLVPPPSETLHYSLNTVQFTADIQRIGERFITEIPITVTHTQGRNVTVVPSALSLRLQGGVEVLSKLKKEEIVATIDFRSRMRYGSNRIPATIKLPKDVRFSDVKPKTFELVVER